MMGIKTKNNGLPETNGGSVGEKKWELRPGGMLVQKRTDGEKDLLPPAPVFRLRVKYGPVYHEVYISSEASFGELKKMLSGPTGLHHQDQKLFYKGKERDSKAFLDSSGVKDKSKIVLVEDAISQEKRYLEMKKTVKMEKSAKSISDISLEVDRLAKKVSTLESIVSKGAKVVEKDLTDLIELLMNQLLKLDGLVVDGDVKLQRKMQVKTVQKNVEILDMLKIKNSTPKSDGPDTPVQPPTPTQPHYKPRYSNGQVSNGSVSSPTQHQENRGPFGRSLTDSPKQQQQPPPPMRRSDSGSSVVITTQWETFDSTPTNGPGFGLEMAPHSSTSKIETSAVRQTQSSFTWDLL